MIKQVISQSHSSQPPPSQDAIQHITQHVTWHLTQFVTQNVTLHITQEDKDNKTI